MRIVAAILSIVVLSNVNSGAVINAPHRARRELSQFGTMIQCTTGIDPLEFVGYGCYCGFGGEGKPVDHIDGCCQQHDLCYLKAVNTKKCPSSSFTYVAWYRLKYSECGTANADISCCPANSYSWYKVNKECAMEICECDRMAAKCFAQGSLFEGYRYYDRSSCSSHRRSKRALDQFRSMVKCTTHRHVLESYNHYGCWCGFGGVGTPVDETDRCCKNHDQCYGEAIDTGKCSNIQSYIARYKFSTTGCRSDASLTCEDVFQEDTDCGKAICTCDREAALCFETASYDSKYRKHSRKTCKNQINNNAQLYVGL
ncbi:uncharacterized protein [Antedon mediterranea]|uniref:uncharacterized protein n=1 Tax=Antedon mediterranea TaxID=105859 RepID=UPI003AF78A56